MLNDNDVQDAKINQMSVFLRISDDSTLPTSSPFRYVSAQNVTGPPRKEGRDERGAQKFTGGARFCVLTSRAGRIIMKQIEGRERVD